MTLRALHRALCLAGLAVLLGAGSASADVPSGDGITVSINAPGHVAEYPALTRGKVVVMNAQRLVVTQEPKPVATLAEAPPEPQTIEVEADRALAPTKSAIWVAGHWIYGPTGFSWVAGRYIAARAGHVFVPPRWAVHDGQHFFFNGFFVPRNVYVRSHFNRYYYTGAPKRGSQSPYGPYWPVGAPMGNGATGALTSARARDPYWPIGARR